MSEPVSLSGRIFTFLGRRVLLDADLARLYGTTTKAFNQAIKRSAGRFPADFAFRLTPSESAVVKAQVVAAKEDAGMRSQSVTSSRPQRRRLSHRPWVFIEHGAVMAANVLRSPKAAAMSVYVVRAFMKQREELATNAAILRRVAEIDKTLLEHDARPAHPVAETATAARAGAGSAATGDGIPRWPAETEGRAVTVGPIRGQRPRLRNLGTAAIRTAR